MLYRPYFSPGDREDFSAFLDALPGCFGVLSDESGTVVGCGGVGTRDEGRTAVLTWGMVRADRHGQGLGRTLALARLRRAAALPGVERVVLNTSNETVGFYQKLGFRVVCFRGDGYRQGLDRYDLELMLADEVRRRLSSSCTWPAVKTPTAKKRFPNVGQASPLALRLGAASQSGPQVRQ